jgi:hypothetical protein
MMGERRVMQEALFYGFSFERHISDKRGSPHLWEGAGFTASNLVRLAQRVALQTRELQPEGPCSERPDDRGYNPAFCRSRRSAIGCQRIPVIG